MGGIELNGGPILWVKDNSKGMRDLYAGMVDWTVVNPQSLKATEILGEGWSQLESSFVWSSQRATILISPEYLPGGTYPTQLEMEVSAFGASPERHVDLYVQSNNSELRESFVDNTIKKIIVPIGSVSSLNEIKIELFIPQATSPSKLTGSEDARILGIALHRFRLSD